MNKIISMISVMGLVCFSSYAIAEETISQENFEDRHSTQAVSGVNGTFSVGYNYSDWTCPALVPLRVLI